RRPVWSNLVSARHDGRFRWAIAVNEQTILDLFDSFIDMHRRQNVPTSQQLLDRAEAPDVRIQKLMEQTCGQEQRRDLSAGDKLSQLAQRRRALRIDD